MSTFTKTLKTAAAVAALCLVTAVGAQAQQYKVAFIARAQADSFAAWLTNGIMDEAKKYSDMKVDVMDAQADDAKENAFIENAVANKYNLIIVQPNNGEAQRPYVERAVKDGIKVITTNARIKNIPGSSSVDADPYEQAAVNARLALKQIPQNAKVVVLNGPSGNMHADMRRDAWQKEFFAKRPDVKIVGEQIAHWNKEEAMRYMEDWVQANPTIDAIVSMNDNMAAGALEVIKNDPKFSKILAYGVDGTAEAMLLIKAGKMTSTALQNAYDLAGKNMSVAHDLLTGKIAQIDTDIDCPLVTKDNVDKFIEIHKKSGAIK
ncbi:MAG: sugar ABC transporter substrate-binding protein [Ancalomicrobiaceae bacterium]|nr:sugar ABC transporter substrate-binding protein [Ancalomicrobiaceae bacterium]